MAVSEEIINKLENQIGVEGQPLSFEIEKGMIKRFARAVGDLNPLWQDADYAAKTGYGGIVAPPNFILTLGFGGILRDFIDDPEITVLHGSTELASYQVIRPGDVITATSKIINIRDRQGEMGKMLFVTFDIGYKNQRNEPVAQCRQMAIIY